MKRTVTDGANIAYAYQKGRTHEKKFSYAAYPEIIKEICQCYGFSKTIATMPKFRYKELRKKCMNNDTCDLIERMVDEGIIHLTGNAPGDDDREALALAMRLDASLITNDKNMNEHFDNYSKEDRQIAELWFANNRIGYFFGDGKLILMDCIPTCLKMEATA